MSQDNDFGGTSLTAVAGVSVSALDQLPHAERVMARNPAQHMRDSGTILSPRNAKKAAADRIWREGVSDKTVDAYLAECDKAGEQ